MPDGCAFIFSGRSNPEWKVDTDKSDRLEEIWNEISGIGSDIFPASLGYSGCSLKFDDREYFTYGGVVTRKEGDMVEKRIDDTKQFEQLLLTTAPLGVLLAIASFDSIEM